MREPYIMMSLPPTLQSEIRRCEVPVEEVHLRVNGRAEIAANGKRMLLESITTENDIRILMDAATNYSLYAAQEYLREGFITTKDGCRIGLAGLVTRDSRGVSAIRKISSLCIRFAREFPGAADGIYRHICRQKGSVLIFGPPGCGKTTLVRDLISQISDCLEERVGIVDERFEICAAVEGVPAMKIGERCDVISGSAKEEGLLMLLRGCAPQWIAVDEITSPRDAAAMERCACCGVLLIATAHAAEPGDLLRRPLYKHIVAQNIFTHYVHMRRDHSYTICSAEALYD